MDYLPRLMSPIYPHEQVVPDYMFTSSRTNLEKINPDLTSNDDDMMMTQEDHVFRRSEFHFMLSLKTPGLIDLLI